jgi:hypothetical protein
MKDREVMSAMDVWEWMTENVTNPAAPSAIVNELLDLFDDESREDIQSMAIKMGSVLSDFYLKAVGDDYEMWGGPYEDYVSGMLEAYVDWNNHMDISLIEHQLYQLPVLYTLMSAKERADILPNELISMPFEWEACIECMDADGYTCIEPIPESPESQFGSTILRRLHAVYVRDSEGLDKAIADFNPGNWAEQAVDAFEMRQEALRNAT